MAYSVSIYLDEFSIEKITNHEELITYILSFIRLFKIVNEGNVEVDVIRSDNYRDTCVQTNKPLLSALSEFVPKDLRVRFKNILFDKKNSIWNENREHSSEDYFEFCGECVTDGTLAEVGERKLNLLKGAMVYLYPFDKFGSDVKITKEEVTDIYVTSLDSEFSIEEWLDREFDVSEFCYDACLVLPPTDKQTYLRESARYIKTEKINQGRCVYKCALTNRYHVVDNMHYGGKSHVEVWDRHGLYIGESNLIGEINEDISSHKKRQKNNPSWL